MLHTVKSHCNPGQARQTGRCTQARCIILMAFGEGKSAAVAQAVEGPVTDQVRALEACSSSPTWSILSNV